MSTVTWVLVEEPDLRVRRVIEILEDRVGADADVQWICPV